MSYAFPKDQPDGTEVELANGVTYRYNQTKNRWAVADVASGDIGEIYSKEQIIKMVQGGATTANFTYEGPSGFPSQYSKFTTDNTDPRRMTKLYMSRRFMEDYIIKDGYLFKRNGIISIQKNTPENIGLYHFTSVIDNGGSDIYFNVAGTGTASSFTVGGQYVLRFAVTFPT